MAKTIVDNADYFAQLDSIVGDGDFGYSLRNGFEVVARPTTTPATGPNVGAVLKKIGDRHCGQGRRRQRPDLGHRLPAGRRDGR